MWQTNMKQGDLRAEIFTKLKKLNTKKRKFDDVVKATVLVVVY